VFLKLTNIEINNLLLFLWNKNLYCYNTFWRLEVGAA
jgi:hypothetical protein